MKYQKEKVKTKNHVKNKQTRNKLNQEVKDIFAENYKTLIKEIEEDSKKENISCIIV